MHANLDNPIDLLLNLPMSEEIQEREQYCQLIQNNSEKFNPALLHQFYSFENEARQRMFVRNLHARLVSVSDSLYDVAKSKIKEGPAASTDGLDALWPVLFIVDGLLAFIRDNFYSFYDKCQKIPEKSKAGIIQEINDKLEKLGLPEDDPDHLLLKK